MVLLTLQKIVNDIHEHLCCAIALQLYFLGTYISQSVSTRLTTLVYAERYGRHETTS